MEKGIPKLETRIIATAFVLSAIHLGLIGYAALKLGITIPSCTTTVKPFTAGELIKQAPDRYEVHVIAKMWAYEPNVIRVPKGSTVDFYLTSKDITHGFFIEKTNVNLMAVPKVVNFAQARFLKPGRYSIMCHEYCGAGHHQMHGIVEVTDSTAEASVEGLAPVAATAASAEALNLPGRQLLDSKGCLVCHTLDGARGLGPTFKGLWGRSEQFTDGTSIAAVNEAYIRESLQDPQKKIVATFGPIMPKLPLTDAEIQQLIDYLKTTK